MLSQGETMDEINMGTHGVSLSVQYIWASLRKDESFEFTLVDESEVYGRLKAIDVTKAARALL